MKPSAGSNVGDIFRNISTYAVNFFRGGPFDSLDEEDWFTGQPLGHVDGDPFLDPGASATGARRAK